MLLKYSSAWFIHLRMRSNHLSKHFFHWNWDTSKTSFLNASTVSSGDKNPKPNIFSWCAAIKRSHWMPSQGSAAVEPSIRFKKVQITVDESELALPLRTMIRLCFLNFSEDFRQTNCDVPLRIDRRTMLKWNSRYMSNFAEETAGHLLRSAFFTKNFPLVWFVFEGPHGGL